MEDSYQPDVEINVSDTTENIEDLQSCGKDCDMEDLNEHPVACNNTFYQTDLISVPVKVVPFAKAGHCTTMCCGSPVITTGGACQGEVNKVCEFTITQKICVKLPLSFGASVSVDQAKIQCGGISETECDCKNPCVRKCD